MSAIRDELRQELGKADLRDLDAIRWQVIYMKATPKEREEIAGAMLQRIESRKNDSIEYLKSMPLALDMLTPSQLMNVVEDAMTEAYDWIIENCPQAREKLQAYDSLTVFYQNQGEKSELDMRDAIEAICKAWGVSQFPAPTETSKPKPTGKAGTKKS